MISDWLAFWDKPQSIYVNARHRDVHYRLIAEELAALVPSRTARVLDYGCGEALHADLVAAAAGELLLCDGAPSVRGAIGSRFAGNPKIRALAPEEVERLPDHCVDFIVLHSVAQYLTAEQAQSLLQLFHRLLQPAGILLVSDVIPPHSHGLDRRCGAIAIRRRQRIFVCRHRRPGAHGCFPITGACARASD